MNRSSGTKVVTLLAASPWWVSMALAPLGYGFCQLIPSLIHFNGPLFTAANILIGLLPRMAPFVAGFFVVMAGISALAALRRRRLLDTQADIESIRDLSWQDFERLVGEAYRRQGYSVEETGGGGADGGVDLRLRRNGRSFIVQCKRWRNTQVGVSIVRELYGLVHAEAAHGAFLVSSGRFTSEAIRFAQVNDVTLIDGDALLHLIRTVQPEGQKAPGLAEGEQPDQPACPSCGGVMVLRMARRGAGAGQSFWGCQSFPKCRGTLGAG